MAQTVIPVISKNKCNKISEDVFLWSIKDIEVPPIL